MDREQPSNCRYRVRRSHRMPRIGQRPRGLQISPSRVQGGQTHRSGSRSPPRGLPDRAARLGPARLLEPVSKVAARAILRLPAEPRRSAEPRGARILRPRLVRQSAIRRMGIVRVQLLRRLVSVEITRRSAHNQTTSQRVSGLSASGPVSRWSRADRGVVVRSRLTSLQLLFTLIPISVSTMIANECAGGGGVECGSARISRPNTVDTRRRRSRELNGKDAAPPLIERIGCGASSAGKALRVRRWLNG